MNDTYDGYDGSCIGWIVLAALVGLIGLAASALVWGIVETLQAVAR